MAEPITCPSGLSGVITGLKGKTLRLLSDKQAVRSGIFLDKIFAECWQETLDNGPYTFSGAPDWSKVLLGDRYYLLVQIRAQSFGSHFSFRVQCPSRGCREQFDHELDLLTDLPVKYLSDEDKAAFTSENRITGTLPDGKQFSFRLLTGTDEAKLVKQAGSMTNFLNVMKSRIIEIEGLDARGMNLYFDEGELSLAYGALEEMDRHDCGVDTKLAISCPNCSEAIDIEIPFGQGFLTPPRRTSQKT